MQQHPVPQNVTSYQFRLIGDMTLKQFLQLLAGGVVAYIFYSTNLVAPIKWFFMFISVISGVAFAFLPLEGRPLDQWLMAFIRAIYLPTQFFWKKVPKLPGYLSNAPTTTPPLARQSLDEGGSPNSNPTLSPTPSYLEPNFDPDADRSRRIEDIISRFDQPNEPIATSPPPINLSPTAPSIPNTSSTAKNIITQDPVSTPSDGNLSGHPPSTPNTNQSPSGVQPLQSVSIKPSSSGLKNLQPETSNLKPDSGPHPIITNKASPSPHPPPLTSLNPTTSSTAIFNPNLPFPSLPETKNTLIGMVTSQEGKIIENAVIEIKNAGGTVRATKTNRLGQFFLATPLKDDSYQIEIEKPGFTFAPISLKLEGKIYPPLDIKSTN